MESAHQAFLQEDDYGCVPDFFDQLTTSSRGKQCNPLVVSLHGGPDLAECDLDLPAMAAQNDTYPVVRFQLDQSDEDLDPLTDTFHSSAFRANHVLSDSSPSFSVSRQPYLASKSHSSNSFALQSPAGYLAKARFEQELDTILEPEDTDNRDYTDEHFTSSRLCNLGYSNEVCPWDVNYEPHEPAYRGDIGELAWQSGADALKCERSASLALNSGRSTTSLQGGFWSGLDEQSLGYGALHTLQDLPYDTEFDV